MSDVVRRRQAAAVLALLPRQVEGICAQAPGVERALTLVSEQNDAT